MDAKLESSRQVETGLIISIEIFCTCTGSCREGSADVVDQAFCKLVLQLVKDDQSMKDYGTSQLQDPYAEIWGLLRDHLLDMTW